MTTDSPIIVALDFKRANDALALVQRLDPSECRLKVGFELFVAQGPGFIERLQQLGFEVFLDLKFHDIPNTVAAACRVAADLGVWMVNVHASGGQRMMAAAREALDQTRGKRPILIAVTVLTSLERQDLEPIGWNREPEEQVLRLAKLAHAAGVEGVVCSAQEAARLRKQEGEEFLLVTPGIRMTLAQSDDQRRILTPKAAMAAGSNYLVVGRPITRASDPSKTINEILVSLGE